METSLLQNTGLILDGMLQVEDESLSGELQKDEYSLEGCLSHVGKDAGDVPTYSGSCTVTPSDEVQVLNTEGSLMNEDVIINPIPSNYGKISWNGFRLRVE